MSNTMKGKQLFLTYIFLLVISSLLVTAQDCPKIESSNTIDFIEELASWDDCDRSLPTPVDFYFKEGIVNGRIMLENGSEILMSSSIEGGRAMAPSVGFSEKAIYIVTIGECSLDTILRNNMSKGVTAYLYNQGQIYVEAQGVWAKVKWFFARMGMKKVLRERQRKVEIFCAE